VKTRYNDGDTAMGKPTAECRFQSDRECLGVLTLIFQRMRAADSPADITAPEWEVLRDLAGDSQHYLTETGFGYEETPDPDKPEPEAAGG
jgi:hypothetical protein